METNHYKVLNVSMEAEQSEIKEAYILKLRQFPVETYPEEFQLVRKAYEILSNKQARIEYDTLAIHGVEIIQLQAEAERAIESRNFTEAIYIYKKILMIEPALLQFRSQLALALIYNGEAKKAIMLLEKIIILNENEASNYYNLGFAYEVLKDFKNAIFHYKKALAKDPNNTNIIQALAEIYSQLEDYESARSLIDEVLSKTRSNSPQQSRCFFIRLQIDLSANDVNAVKQTLLQFENIVTSEGDQYDIAIELGKHAFQLYERKNFEFAILLIETAVKLAPQYETLLDLHKETIKQREMYKSFEYLDADQKVIKPLKYCIFLYLFGDEYPEVEFEKSTEEMFNQLSFAAEYEPEKTLKSIKVLAIKYPILYQLRRDLFRNLEELCY